MSILPSAGRLKRFPERTLPPGGTPFFSNSGKESAAVDILEGFLEGEALELLL